MVHDLKELYDNSDGYRYVGPARCFDELIYEADGKKVDDSEIVYQLYDSERSPFYVLGTWKRAWLKDLDPSKRPAPEPQPDVISVAKKPYKDSWVTVGRACDIGPFILYKGPCDYATEPEDDEHFIHRCTGFGKKATDDFEGVWFLCDDTICLKSVGFLGVTLAGTIICSLVTDDLYPMKINRQHMGIFVGWLNHWEYKHNLNDIVPEESDYPEAVRLIEQWGERNNFEETWLYEVKYPGHPKQWFFDTESLIQAFVQWRSEGAKGRFCWKHLYESLDH